MYWGPEIPLLYNFLITLLSYIQWEQAELSVLSLCWQGSYVQGLYIKHVLAPLLKSVSMVHPLRYQVFIWFSADTTSPKS